MNPSSIQQMDIILPWRSDTVFLFIRVKWLDGTSLKLDAVIHAANAAASANEVILLHVCSVYSAVRHHACRRFLSRMSVDLLMPVSLTTCA